MSDISQDAVIAELEGVTALFQQQFKDNTEQHSAILEQTTKTNGKVAEIKAWKERIHGAWVVICILGSVLMVVVPTLVSVYFNKTADNRDFNAKFDSRISEYIEKNK